MRKLQWVAIGIELVLAGVVFRNWWIYLQAPHEPLGEAIIAGTHAATIIMLLVLAADIYSDYNLIRRRGS